jgi:hypothetical protein
MRGRVILALGLLAVGLVWIAQGTGLLPGSGVMSGDLRWAAIGVVSAVVGVVILISARRSRPPA